MPTNVMTPTPNINGTSRSALMSDWSALGEALSKSRDALRNLEFHPRDYGFRGGNSFEAARERFEEHAKAIQAALDDAREVWGELFHS